MKHFVVTISRDFGTLGWEIGQRLAEELGVSFYDRHLVEEAAHRVGTDTDKLYTYDEKISIRSLLFSNSNVDYSLSDSLIHAQSEIIKELYNKEESCVIIGRCADFVLAEKPNCLHVLIRAPFEFRVKNIMDSCELPREESEKMIRHTDRQRKIYHRYVTDRPATDGKHLVIDSSLLGIDGTVALLKFAVEQAFGDKT